MRKELKNLREELIKAGKSGGSSFSDINLEWQAFYIFIKRYRAIRSDFKLPDIIDSYDVKEDTDLSANSPYHKTFKPYLEYIKSKYHGFKVADTEPILELSENLKKLEFSDIQILEKIISRSGIENFTLKTFSLEEFDEFFLSLQKIVVTGESLNNTGISRQFAKLIAQYLPKKSTYLPFNDFYSDVAQQANINELNLLTFFNENKTHIKSKVWSLLRLLLDGKKNVQLLHGTKESVDFAFYYPDSQRFNEKKYSTRKLEFELVAKLLKEKGQLFIVLPADFLHKQGSKYKNLRKDFLKTNNVKSITKLPGRIVESSNTAHCLIHIDYSQKYDHIRFIDGHAIAFTEHSKQDSKTVLAQVSSYLNGEVGSYPHMRDVSSKEIEQNSHSWAFYKYFNVSHEEKKYLRSDSERLVSLTEALERKKLERKKGVEDAPILSISELADNVVDYEIDINKLSKRKKLNKAKILDGSVILLGKKVGSVKPSFFMYKGQPIYMKNRSNMLAFEATSNIYIPYIIHELRSDFVKKQFQKIKTAKNTSSYTNDELDNIYLRIPSKEEQEKIVQKELKGIAQNKIDEIEGLHENIRFVEQEVFSSFAHDFGKYLQKVSSNISTFEKYLKRLDDKGIIDLNNSVFFEENVKPQDRVISVVNQLNENHKQSQEFLKNEVEKIANYSNSTEQNQIIDLRTFLENWKKRQNPEKCRIVLLNDTNSDAGQLSKSYAIDANRVDIQTTLNNFLDNAETHGFKKDDKNNEFVISVEEHYRDEGRLQFTTLHIGNNGQPFPKDFTCKEFFRRNEKGRDSQGKGFGGYLIKKKLNEMGAKIDCHSSLLSDDKYPVQFEISFKPIEYGG